MVVGLGLINDSPNKKDDAETNDSVSTNQAEDVTITGKRVLKSASTKIEAMRSTRISTPVCQMIC